MVATCQGFVCVSSPASCSFSWVRFHNFNTSSSGFLPQLCEEVNVVMWTAWLFMCCFSGLNASTCLLSIDGQTHSEAFLHPQTNHVYFSTCFDNWQISYSFSSLTDSSTLSVYKEIMFDIPKLKLCSIDPEYCMLFFFVFCHVIEDKCWQRSFKQSMRLKCTAGKECIKYINKSIFEGLCSKTFHTPRGNDAAELVQVYWIQTRSRRRGQ